MDFSSNGKYMALAERRDCKDHVSLFDCSQWQLVRHFPVETSDLAGLSWSPDAKVLCVWDSVLDYKVFLYSLDGRCLSTFSAYDHALGIKCIQWSPTSQFLAIGSFDQKLRILNHVTWKTVAEHLHTSPVESSGAVVYVEMENKVGGGMLKSSGSGVFKSSGSGTFKSSIASSTSELSHFYLCQSKYEAQEVPVTIPSTKPDPEKPNPKLGVSTVVFSADSRYVATKNDNMPCAVWIWDVTNLRLSVVLLQTNPIREIKWDPTQPRLAVCTANNKLYLWSPAGCVSVAVPVEANIAVQRLLWHPSGKCLALIGSSHFCVCYTLDNEAAT